MGRGVSYPKGSIVCFQDVSEFGSEYKYVCPECGNIYYELDDTDVCECGCTLNKEEYIDEDSATTDWEFFKEDLIETAKELYPSLEDSSGWLGREDVILLENNLVYFGVSEYCGTASIWITPKDDIDRPHLAKIFVSKIEKTFNDNFGDLKKIGTFSNGECVYESK